MKRNQGKHEGESITSVIRTAREQHIVAFNEAARVIHAERDDFRKKMRKTTADTITESKSSSRDRIAAFNVLEEKSKEFESVVVSLKLSLKDIERDAQNVGSFTELVKLTNQCEKDLVREVKIIFLLSVVLLQVSLMQSLSYALCKWGHWLHR
jgi:hypothetical protein